VRIFPNLPRCAYPIPESGEVVQLLVLSAGFAIQFDVRESHDSKNDHSCVFSFNVDGGSSQSGFCTSTELAQPSRFFGSRSAFKLNRGGADSIGS